MICLCCEKELRSMWENNIGCIDKGGTIEVEFGYGSEYDMARHADLPIDWEDETRDLQLMQCDKIVGFICDDCFKEKQHLFSGYSEVKTYSLEKRL